jgi:hypothetical protein
MKTKHNYNTIGDMVDDFNDGKMEVIRPLKIKETDCEHILKLQEVAKEKIATDLFGLAHNVLKNNGYDKYDKFLTIDDLKLYYSRYTIGNTTTIANTNKHYIDDDKEYIESCIPHLVNEAHMIYVIEEIRDLITVVGLFEYQEYMESTFGVNVCSKEEILRVQNIIKLYKTLDSAEIEKYLHEYNVEMYGANEAEEMRKTE